MPARISVPRFSDGVNWSPLSISGLAVWLDASDAATITSSSGAISQWNDKSGNANHFVQATGAAKPTTGINSTNGLNVVTFDGGDLMTCSASSAAVSADWTLFSVFYPDAVSATEGQIVTSHNGQQVYQFRHTTSMESFAFSTTGQGGGTQTATKTGVTATTWRMGCARNVSASTLSSFLDGVEGTPATYAFACTSSGTTTLTLGAYTGGSNYFSGRQAEFLQYNSALSVSNRQAVEVYLRNKWGTP